MKLTREEKLNGWDEASLATYRRERDNVADVVPGNVVTVFQRGKPALRIEGVRGFNPHFRSFG